MTLYLHVTSRHGNLEFATMPHNVTKSQNVCLSHHVCDPILLDNEEEKLKLNILRLAYERKVLRNQNATK